MNAEELLRHFERVADTPDAVPRLRQLVLDLAVRGKLLRQQPGDQSQAKALVAARIELGERAKATGRLRFTPSAPITEAEIGGQLPTGWVAARINDTGLYINGLAFKPSDWKPSGLPIIRIQNLSDESREFNYAQGEFADEVLVRTGDILVSWSATLDAYVWKRQTGVLNQHIFRVIQATGLTESGYLLLLLKRAIRDLSESVHAHGLVMTHINRGPFLNHVVWIPPLAEQRRIVAKVDELMALCDRLEAARVEREAARDRLAAASLARLNAADPEAFADDACFVLDALPALTARPDQIKQLRQTILGLAIRGRLVQRRSADGSAHDFDPQLPAELARPFELPATWRWARLRTLGKLSGGGTPSKSRDDFWNGHIPWISPKDMKRDYLSSAQLNITSSALSGSAATLIEAGSILFVVRGMILAHSFPVAMTKVPVAINQDMKALVLHVPDMAEFLLRALKALKPEVLSRVQRSSHGTCRLEGSDYADFLLPVPPEPEQRRIVAKVDELMALCDQLESYATSGDRYRRRLLEAILHKALEPGDSVGRAA